MKILTLDIETYPHLAYIWQTGRTFVPPENIIEEGGMMCWAAKWYGKREVLFNNGFTVGKERMIISLWNLLDQADAVVHWNGKRFDVPMINREFLKQKMGPPSPFKQIDLLKTSRTRFRFPSNKLDYVLKELHERRKLDHAGMGLWIACVNGCCTALSTMKRYNINDVRITEKAYKRFLPWIQSHPNWGLYENGDRPVCPNCGSKRMVSRGTAKSNSREYRRFCCSNCGKWAQGTRSVPRDNQPNMLKGLE